LTPIVKKGEVVVSECMSLALSVDHRVLDGAMTAAFLKTLTELLENPSLLLVS